MPEKKYPKRRDTDKTAEVGVNAVASIINDDFGWMFRRNHLENDFGVDGYIDFVSEEGNFTGKYCAVQIKTGKSYLKIVDSSYWYFDTEQHLNYFMNQPTPLMLILCDPESKICFWTFFDVDQVLTREKRWKQSIDTSDLLNVEKKQDIGKAIHSAGQKEGWERAPSELALRTDGKFEFENVVISYDAWMMSNSVTCVKLNFSEKLDEAVSPVMGAVNAVKAFLGSVGARGQYMHATVIAEKGEFKKLSTSCTSAYKQQFNDWFLDFLDGSMKELVEEPHMEGKKFDWIACNTKGTGEWSLFLFDITGFYVPEQFDGYRST